MSSPQPQEVQQTSVPDIPSEEVNGKDTVSPVQTKHEPNHEGTCTGISRNRSQECTPPWQSDSVNVSAPEREILWKIRNFPTMFGKINESNITFCIDTSGSMYGALQLVKDHVTEAIFQKSIENRECHFNLIEYSSQVTQWSDKQVKCTPQTAAVAAQWISELQATTSTNMLDALLSAFSDVNCDAVYLITDGNPDQHPTEILDNVAYISQNRPVHCFYLQTGDQHQSSVEFLRELAMETYGSFHIIAMSQAGAIERITPIYRAEMAAERVIRTTDGNVFPSTHKVCSITTTLDNPPNVIIDRTPEVIIREVDPWYPYLPHAYYTHGRYAYHFQHPHYGSWSKWRPAKAWSKFTQNLADASQVPPPAPGPGAMLINTKVLARRNDDGLYYLGTVKSQVLSNKFLVEFGPCKHGKYKDTVYQETYVHDMVSHTDALRHSVVNGDTVLAPWQPEGERYGPGMVIEGQEKRAAPGGGSDSDLVVSFHNGKSATVPVDTAVWVPPQLHERIKFELQLPTSVRKEFAEQESYPRDNLPGYPTSGIRADPDEFYKGDPRLVQQIDPFMAQRGIYDNGYYSPMYPVYYKYQARPCAVGSEVVDSMVPGTDLTKTQLNEKVMQQLMEHKMTLHDSREEKTCEVERERLLERREKVGENTMKKSVSFQDRDRDELSDIEAEYYSGDLDLRDSGHGSATDMEIENLEGEDGKVETRDIGIGTSGKRVFLPRRLRSASPSKPRWGYWNTDPAPSLLEPMHYGPHRVGPYDGEVAAAPLELRHNRISKEQMGYTTSLTQYVDPYAKYNYEGNATIKDSMGYIPRPPAPKPEKQGPGVPLSEVLGEKQRELDRVTLARREVRRQQILSREQGIQGARDERYLMQKLMQDQHKQRILSQLDHERQRQINDMEKLAQAREAKKQINTQIRVKIETNQAREQARESERLAALQKRRVRREDILQQRQQELEDIRAKRQEIRNERVVERYDAVTQRLMNEDAMLAARDKQARQAHASRIDHFRKIEENQQKIRDLQGQVKENASAVFRSTIIS